jgi:hypothetical protein
MADSIGTQVGNAIGIGLAVGVGLSAMHYVADTLQPPQKRKKKKQQLYSNHHSMPMKY